MPTPSQAPAPSAPAQGAAGLPVNGGGLQAAQGLLRGPVGCNNVGAMHLTAAEREACAQRFGEAAKKAAPFSGIPVKKHAYYDAIQHQYQLMRADAPVNNRARGGLGLFEDDGVLIRGQMAGHMGGVGCGMKFGAGEAKPDHRSLSDKIKATGMIGVDIGPLKCGIVLPQGSLTPEIGIAPP